MAGRHRETLVSLRKDEIGGSPTPRLLMVLTDIPDLPASTSKAGVQPMGVRRRSESEAVQSPPPPTPPRA